MLCFLTFDVASISSDSDDELLPKNFISADRLSLFFSSNEKVPFNCSSDSYFETVEILDEFTESVTSFDSSDFFLSHELTLVLFAFSDFKENRRFWEELWDFSEPVTSFVLGELFSSNKLSSILLELFSELFASFGFGKLSFILLKLLWFNEKVFLFKFILLSSSSSFEFFDDEISPSNWKFSFFWVSLIKTSTICLNEAGR